MREKKKQFKLDGKFEVNIKVNIKCEYPKSLQINKLKFCEGIEKKKNWNQRKSKKESDIEKIQWTRNSIKNALLQDFTSWKMQF